MPAAASGDSVVARLETDEATAQRVMDLASDAFDAADVAGCMNESAPGHWTAALYFQTPPNLAAVRALVAFAAGAEAANALAFESVAARDWVKASLDGLAPVAAGRFIVHGAHDRLRVPANKIGIEIEAALAFGTGHHGTTRGCLIALDRIVKGSRSRQRPSSPPLAWGRTSAKRSGGGFLEGRAKRWLKLGRGKLGTPPRITCGDPTLPLPGRVRRKARRARPTAILDVGTGSGVLAIAAARALRAPVLASDIDPLAARAAGANVRLNRAGTLVEIRRFANLGARRFRERGPFDLILANILLGPLLRLAAPMTRLAARHAHIVLSGLLPSQASAILAAYRMQGLALEQRLLLEGWVTLVLRSR